MKIFMSMEFETLPAVEGKTRNVKIGVIIAETVKASSLLEEGHT
jgi:hypothetical protein